MRSHCRTEQTVKGSRDLMTLRNKSCVKVLQAAQSRLTAFWAGNAALQGENCRLHLQQHILPSPGVPCRNRARCRILLASTVGIVLRADMPYQHLLCPPQVIKRLPHKPLSNGP